MTSTLPSPSAGQERDYPPLPEMVFLGDSARYGYDDQSMRDYVDDDRKARQLAACNFCLEQVAEARAALTSASKQAGGEPELLRGVDALLREAYEHWDADREFKVGKILLALIGFNKGYDKRADAWCAALKPKPAPLNGGCGDGESDHG